MSVIRLFLIIIILLGAGWFLSREPDVRSRFAQVDAMVRDIAHDREVRFEGLSLLDEVDLVPLLPTDQSTAWWGVHREELRSALETHPLVKRVEVTNCSAASLTCFRFQVEERRPMFIATEGARDGPLQGWVVADDGAFLLPFRGEEKEASIISIGGFEFRDLPVVMGVTGDSVHPQRLAARAVYTANVLQRLAAQFSIPVRRASLTERGEFEVSFRGGPQRVVFEDVSDDIDRVDTQIARLAALKEKLGAGFARAERIDLAFDRLAVVKFPGGAREVD